MRAGGAEDMTWKNILRFEKQRRAMRLRCWIFTRRISGIRQSHSNTTCRRQRNLPRALQIFSKHTLISCASRTASLSAMPMRTASASARRTTGRLSCLFTSRRRRRGRAWVQCLTDLLVLQQMRVLYGCVTLPNGKSQKLHEKLGFSLVGVWHGSGWKRNGWHDVGWFEKRIGACCIPQPVAPFEKLDRKKIQACLHRYTEKLNDGGLN